MSSAIVQHTLSIFDRLCKEIPPLVPSSVAESMNETLRELREIKQLDLFQLEDAMVAFGKETWAYREAFLEFLLLYEEKHGERFFTAHLSRSLQKRYSAFRKIGGTRKDIERGRLADFFLVDERLELRDACLRMRSDLRAHAVQAVLSVDRGVYEKKIAHFQAILSHIEDEVEELRTIEKKEQGHPAFAAEIHDHIRSFEFGLCALGPKLSYDDLRRSREHFMGRVTERKR